MSSNNFLKQILQGGACSTDANPAALSQSSNPFKNFINELVVGKARTKQRLEGFYPDEETIAHPMQSPVAQTQPNSQQLVNNITPSHLDMEIMAKEWRKEQKQFEEMRNASKVEEKRHLKQPQEYVQPRHYEDSIEAQWSMLQRLNESRLNHSRSHWNTQQYLMQTLGQRNISHNVKQVEKSFYLNIPSQNTSTESISQMVDLMKSDPDPRFQGSKYLKFLEKMKEGNFQQDKRENVEDKAENQGTEMTESKQEEIKPDEAALEEEMEEIWAQEEKAFDEKEKEMDQVFEDYWQGIEAQAKEQGMVSECLEKDEQINDKALEEAWDDTKSEEESLEEEFDLGIGSEYLFSDGNPYIFEHNCLESAIKFLNTGETRNAILCLESALQKNIENRDIWRLLGKIYQDNDQERQGVICLAKAIKLDSKNTDTLLALGVALINIDDEVRAMKCLRRWALTNKKYRQITRNNNVLKQINFERMGSFNTYEIRLINKKMRDEFEVLSSANPSDPELNTCLALLNYINSDYKSAIHFFNEALKLDPKNYTLWNRLGVTLAHISDSNSAINAYYRALEYKPNYVKAWVNLGISQAFKGEYEEAARLYLSALSLNPKAQHIWRLLESALLSAGKYNLSKKVAERNLEVFKNEFEIISFEDLPPPEIEYKELNSEVLIKKDIDQWVAEF